MTARSVSPEKLKKDPGAVDRFLSSRVGKLFLATLALFSLGGGALAMSQANKDSDDGLVNGTRTTTVDTNALRQPIPGSGGTPDARGGGQGGSGEVGQRTAEEWADDLDGTPQLP